MNRKHLTGLIAIGATLTTIGITGISLPTTKTTNKILLVNSKSKSINQNSKYLNSLELATSSQYKMRITTAFIGIPKEENSFAADPTFNPNGFASTLNQKLYQYESSTANQTAAMDEAITLHDGNPENTCVYFQSSCLRAIGVNVPDDIAYTTHLENFLQNNGWQKETNFNYIQKGDICFAGDTHTFLFMGWENKSKGIAYVMGDEAYMFGSSYSNRNLNGQTANQQNGWNNQYEATCFWKYTGNYTGGQVQNSPTNNWIGRVAITSPVGLWMNKEPNANSNKITCIGNNIILNVIKQENGWYEVYYDGNYGWVDGQYTTGLGNPTESKSENVENANIPSNISDAIGTTVTTSLEGLDLCSSPSFSNSAVITSIPNATKLYIFKEGNNGWEEVYYNGNYGWIYSEYTLGITKINNTNSTNSSSKATKPSSNTNTGKQITIESPIGLWMTKSPEAYSGNIICIPYNTKVTATAEENGWYKISYNGDTGWVDGAYTTSANFNNTGSTSKSNNNTSPKTSTTENKILGQVTVESPVGLWMTKEAEPYSGNITCLNYNTTVNVIGESNGWYEINYNGQTGWIDGTYTTNLVNTSNTTNSTNNSQKTTKPATNTNTGKQITIESPIGLWMTRSPEPYSGNIVCIPYNTNVTATAEENGWYKISYNGETGWVDGAYTTSTNFNNTSNNSENNSNNTPKTSTTENKILGQVTVESPVGLWMTKEAEPYSGNITCLNYNTTVNVIGESNGWYEINYNGQTGWIDDSYTSSLYTTSNNSTLPNLVQVNSPIGLYMSYGPNGEGGNITCLPSGYILHVLNKENGWYKVVDNLGQVGWVDATYTTA